MKSARIFGIIGSLAPVIGSILAEARVGVISSVAPIVGSVLLLVAVKAISDGVKERRIFTNMVIATVVGIGEQVGLFISTGLYFLPLGSINSGPAGFESNLGAAPLAILVAVLILSPFFLWRSYREISVRLRIKYFKTAGEYYLTTGAVIAIALIGVALGISSASLIFLLAALVSFLSIGYGFSAYYSIHEEPGS